MATDTVTGDRMKPEGYGVRASLKQMHHLHRRLAPSRSMPTESFKAK